MSTVPLIVFGAFDRHNFGDLLFPHVVRALLPGRELVFAGAAGRDLRPFGGHRVEAIATVAREWGERPAHLLHAGGEILTVDAWQAAAMLLPPEDVAGVVAMYRDDAQAGIAWARRYLGIAHDAAYVVPRRLFRRPGRWLFGGVGGVALDRIPPPLRREVAETLRSADFAGVRDELTLATLRAAGIEAQLMPDPAVMVGELFGDLLCRHGEAGEPAAVRAAFPRGYLAVQFSADFGDDATLALIAAQFDRVAVETGLGVVLFRAGAAPWHDDLEALRRAASRMLTFPRVFESLDLWDICALVAASRGYCGSSLHGRILALDFGLPRVSLVAVEDEVGKQRAFARTWDAGEAFGVVAPGALADATLAALGVGSDPRRTQAARLSTLYRERFAALSAMLESLPAGHPMGGEYR